MNSNLRNIIEEYCTGCGLCHNVCQTKMYFDKKGFLCAHIESEQEEKFCKNVCASMNNRSIYQTPWGDGEAYNGWSTNKRIRYSASSGGIITALCIYLLKSGKVDAILQIGVSDEKPWQTKIYCNQTEDEVIKCCGSRYASSSPLLNISEVFKEGKRYAFVGKPCDIVTLKNWQKIEPEITNKIPYMLSFFCAGMPSETAQKRLMDELQCRPEDCQHLYYRGNGWPGYATAIRKDGTETRISYNDSWGKILGRDIRKVCRVCIDGVGEQADVACGDAWYLLKNKVPDFSEHDGRNVVFGRTAKGQKLLKEAWQRGYIELKSFDLEELKYMQKFQLERRSTTFAKILALKVMGRRIPKYSMKKILQFTRCTTIKSQYEWFRGSISRIRQGKL